MYFLRHGHAVIFGMLFVVIIGVFGCQKKMEEAPVSISSRCISFNFKGNEAKALKGELAALRAMRDFSMECLPSEQSAQALRWAELAAEKGDQNDNQVWKDLQEIFGRKGTAL